MSFFLKHEKHRFTNIKFIDMNIKIKEVEINLKWWLVLLMIVIGILTFKIVSAYAPDILILILEKLSSNK